MFASFIDVKNLYIKMIYQTQPDVEIDTSGIHLWLVLWKAAHKLETHSDRSIARFGMCRSDFGVLEALLHRGPLTVKELSAKVLLTSGSMTAAVDRLVARKLVARHEDGQDRRARVIQLTPAGTKLIRNVFEEHKAAMEDAVSDFPKAQRAALIRLLRRLGKGVEEKLQVKQKTALKNAGRSVS